jgi:hypothetical protein
MTFCLQTSRPKACRHTSYPANSRRLLHQIANILSKNVHLYNINENTYVEFSTHFNIIMSSCSAVGIAIGYGLDDLGVGDAPLSTKVDSNFADKRRTLGR